MNLQSHPSHQEQPAKSYCLDVAEAKDAPPVANAQESASDAAWRIISEWNVAKGYVSHESLLKLSKVLHPEVSL